MSSLLIPGQSSGIIPSPLNDRVAVGIVGLNFGGYIVKQIMSGPGREYFRVDALCDLDPARLLPLSRQIEARAYDSLDALLDDPAISVIGLFTGPAGRTEMIRRIIRAGKDVLTTKPFELDVDAARDVLAEARALGKIIHLNSPSPFTPPDLAQIEMWRRDFNLGRPVGARAEVWANYQEDADGSWYDDPSRCPVAPIFRLGIYLINDLIRTFGPVDAVQVFRSRLRTGRPTPDNAQLGMMFKNGALANVSCSFCVDDFQPHRQALVLNFERGTIYRNVGPFPRFQDEDLRMRLKLVTRGPGNHPLILRKQVASGSGDYQWATFFRALHEREIPPASTAENILEGLKVIAAMTRADKSQCMESV